MLKPLLALCLLLPTLAAAGDAELLSDSELAEVDGRQGVLLNLSLRNNVDANNAPIGCTVAIGTPNPCRLGLEFAARNGVWLMLKEFYGTLKIVDMRLDAGFLPGTATAWRDTTRFQDSAGDCLIPSCNPSSRPTVLVTYPNADAPATYNDFLSFLNIGRTWLEFDNGGTPGYQRDTSSNSVFGVRMSDSATLNGPARMRFRGTGYVYGF